MKDNLNQRQTTENNEKQRNSEQLAHCNTWKGSRALHGGDMATDLK